MDIKRREFLKIAGVSAIAGVGVPAAFQTLFRGEAVASSEQAHGEQKSAAHGETAAPAKTGKRMGMVVDVRKFAEDHGLLQKCIAACHTEHNVPDYRNPKDEIKWIWEESYEHIFPEHSHYKRNDELHHLPFATLCNHCDSPPCVRACPTKATFKMDNGLVVMDYHRCIGCRFCMAACPYGARSFNWRDPRGKDENGRPFIAKINYEYPTRMRGVVEKCTFCPERLAKGLAPACVEATGDTKALIFGDMNDEHSEISQVLKSNFTLQRKPSAGTNPSLFYII